VIELDAELIAELRHRQVAEAARANGSERHAARFRFRSGDDIAKRFVRLIGDA